jgi:prepilin-type processing-associated H-X9-DG protein
VPGPDGEFHSYFDNESYDYRGWIMTSYDWYLGWIYCSFARGFWMFTGVIPQEFIDQDLEIPHSTRFGAPPASVRGKTLLRHREGVERMFITDINNPAASMKAQSAIPVMWDTSEFQSTMGAPPKVIEFSHIPGGGNVLYMDGHTEFVKYPGEFPYEDRRGAF